MNINVRILTIFMKILVNLITRVNLQFEKYMKNGEEYVKIKTFKVKFQPEKVHLIFKNLFDGDPVLGKNIHLILYFKLPKFTFLIFFISLREFIK